MNMVFVLLAKKYAAAFLNCYQQKLTPTDYEHLKKIGNDLNGNPEMIALLNVPHIPLSIKKQFLIKLIKTYELPPVILNLFTMLIVHQRIFLLKLVFDAIVSLHMKRLNLLPVLIRSSQELSDDQLLVIKKFLEQKTECHLLVTTCIDHTLIAGIRMESKNWLWEHSVAQHLKQAQQLTRR